MSPPAPVPQPMLAVTRTEPFDSPAHVFEPKWDGIRCLARSDGRSVQLFSRNMREITDKFPEVASRPGLDPLHSWIVDGELIVLGADGNPSFDTVRDRLHYQDEHKIARAGRTSPAILALFDLLVWGEHPQFEVPLEKRRHLLERAFVGGPAALLSPVTAEHGRMLFAAVAKQGLEGIIAKERTSPYLPGQRSQAWIKVRRTTTGHFWIVGLVPGGQDRIRSLAVADRDSKGALQYAGLVGSGFTEATRRRLYRALAPTRPTSALAAGLTDGSTLWMEPTLQCRVEYLERTKEGLLRHPVFRGLVQPDLGGV